MNNFLKVLPGPPEIKAPKGTRCYSLQERKIYEQIDGLRKNKWVAVKSEVDLDAQMLINFFFTTPQNIVDLKGTALEQPGSGGGVTTFSGGTTGLTPAAPTSSAVILAGTLVVANGGTGLSALGSGLQYLRVNTEATALEYATFPSVVTDDPFPKILMLMGG